MDNVVIHTENHDRPLRGVFPWYGSDRWTALAQKSGSPCAGMSEYLVSGPGEELVTSSMAG